MNEEGQRAALQLINLKLKDLVATLVKFATHDDACARVRSAKRSEDLAPCSCGLQKVYDLIDALIDD